MVTSVNSYYSAQHLFDNVNKSNQPTSSTYVKNNADFSNSDEIDKTYD